MKEKICGKCKKVLLISAFSVDRTKRGGLCSYCKVCANINSKRYYANNIEHIKQYKKIWQKANAKHLNQYHKQWQNKNRLTLRGSLNSRMYHLICHCLKGQQTSPILEKMAGYSPQELRDHFNSLFTDGMSWENYGLWETDHIRPICSFNYDSPDDPEFQACWSLSNLQPLWQEDNAKKGTNFDERR